MRVNGFLTDSGLKKKAWPGLLSGSQDIHVGYYNYDTVGTSPDPHAIRLAHLTYHTEASFGGTSPVRPGVLLPPEGVGQYVGADHSGR